MRTPPPSHLPLYPPVDAFFFRSSSHNHLSNFPFTLHLTKRCNNGVTCARIYCQMFIYMRMRLRRPRAKWKGYYVLENYPTSLLLFEVISHIGLCSWIGRGSRGRDQNKIASEGDRIDAYKTSGECSRDNVAPYGLCWLSGARWICVNFVFNNWRKSHDKKGWKTRSNNWKWIDKVITMNLSGG